MTRSTPFSARCSAVLRPRPRLAPLTSANLGCVAMRDFPSSICGALRVPNDTIRYTVLTHHDAGGGWPAEGIVCPGIGDLCRTVWVTDPAGVDVQALGADRGVELLDVFAVREAPMSA